MFSRDWWSPRDFTDGNPHARPGGILLRKNANGTLCEAPMEIWEKAVDRNCSWFCQWYAYYTLHCQAEALDALGDMAASYEFTDGILKEQDVKKFDGTDEEIYPKRVTVA